MTNNHESPVSRQALPVNSNTIRWAQQRLNTVLKISLPVDGQLTPATRKALADFQQNAGLRPGGQLTSGTIKALRRIRPAGKPTGKLMYCVPARPDNANAYTRGRAGAPVHRKPYKPIPSRIPAAAGAATPPFSRPAGSPVQRPAPATAHTYTKAAAGNVRPTGARPPAGTGVTPVRPQRTIVTGISAGTRAAKPLRRPPMANVSAYTGTAVPRTTSPTGPAPSAKPATRTTPGKKGCHTCGREHAGCVTIAGFSLNSAQLTPAHKKYLDQLAQRILRDDVTIVTLTGHTDKSGTADFNRQLGLNRAKTAADYLRLRMHGLQPQSQFDRLWKLKSSGETRPAGTDPVRNRRVNICLRKVNIPQ